MKCYVVTRSDSSEDWVRVEAESAARAAAIGAEIRWENIPPGTKVTAWEGKDPFHTAPLGDADFASIIV